MAEKVPMATKAGKPSIGPFHRLAGYAVPAVVVVTLFVALVGTLLAVRIVSDSTSDNVADGRAPTSFGALWVDSFQEITTPKVVQKGHIGMPQPGDPDKVALEVAVRLANTTAEPVELTPARFALRLDAGEPVPVEGATFESVKLLPGAMFDARIQFPVQGGDHRLSLLFDEPDGSGPISVDLGQMLFQQPATDGQHH